MENDRLTVALVQMACSPDRAANRRHIHEQLRAAASRGARLVLLQELHDSLYFCQNEDSGHFDLAEPIPGPATAAFEGLVVAFVAVTASRSPLPLMSSVTTWYLPACESFLGS